jgi:hypothetical protein
MAGDLMTYWAVARTQPQREQFAIKMLAIRSFTETYLPCIRARVTRHRKNVTAEVAAQAGHQGLLDF